MDEIQFILNGIFTFGILVTYYPLIIWEGSQFKILVKHYFEAKNWDDEAKLAVRQHASISTILAALSLASVPFVINLDYPDDSEPILGVIAILSSSALFFWALGLNYNASVHKNNSELAAKFFKTGYYLGAFGVFLFFTGLIWSLNYLNPMYTSGSLITYYAILVFVVFLLKPNKDRTKK